MMASVKACNFGTFGPDPAIHRYITPFWVKQKADIIVTLI